MSWQDREYARGADFDEGWSPTAGARLRGWWRRSTVHTLILINVAVFALNALMSDIGPGRGASPLVAWGILSVPEVTSGQVWRLLTATFLHAGVMHLLVNMLGLYFFGRAVENCWGRRTTLTVYLAAGVLANVAFVALYPMGLWGPRALGASGSVLAMLGAAAVLMPNMRVYAFWGLFPMPMYVLALVLGAGYFFNAMRGGFNAGGDAVHLVGLLIGAGWAWREKRGRTNRAARWREPVGAALRPPKRTSAGEAAPRGWAASAYERDQQLLDDLLAKVKEKGLTGLTEAQRRQLQEISERMRGDHFGP